jgi:hypothetical protein
VLDKQGQHTVDRFLTYSLCASRLGQPTWLPLHMLLFDVSRYLIVLQQFCNTKEVPGDDYDMWSICAVPSLGPVILQSPRFALAKRHLELVTAHSKQIPSPVPSSGPLKYQAWSGALVHLLSVLTEGSMRMVTAHSKQIPTPYLAWCLW